MCTPSSNNLAVYLQGVSVTPSSNITTDYFVTASLPSSSKNNRVWQFTTQGLLTGPGPHTLTLDYTQAHLQCPEYNITFEGALQGSLIIHHRVFSANKYVSYVQYSPFVLVLTIRDCYDRGKNKKQPYFLEVWINDGTGLVYSTEFSSASSISLFGSCYNASGRQSNPFTAFNPCLKCANKNMQEGTLGINCLKIQFPPTTGPSFWTRVGADASSSCTTSSGTSCCTDNTCCPPLTTSNLPKGRFEGWIYFPPLDPTKRNDCNTPVGGLGKVYPFYHGGKLLGVCSQQCPTGNVWNETYDTDWTLRIMFREKGVVALLYSIPDPTKIPFSYEPVPPPLYGCCPGGDCSGFYVEDKSVDQYWFATPDATYHPYRLAEYTFNSVQGIQCGVTQTTWPGPMPNPIVPILEAGTWNFLRVKFDVLEGTAQLLHTVDTTSTSTNPSQAPSYTPEDEACTVVINTPPGTIPFTSKQGAKSFYFQPFFGGKSPEWDPTCVDDSCKDISGTNCAPFFVFGDVNIYQD